MVCSDPTGIESAFLRWLRAVRTHAGIFFDDQLQFSESRQLMQRARSTSESDQHVNWTKAKQNG